MSRDLRDLVVEKCKKWMVLFWKTVVNFVVETIYTTISLHNPVGLTTESLTIIWLTYLNSQDLGNQGDKYNGIVLLQCQHR